ncbi:relaxase/mobilization nuclease domain-containing protein [Sphingomonas morindae]|uniref:Relaxase/mobilization nuclease domain-containing protein n=1 Tax=Sphingomonas morindae TaxID=1541170 RepID=A0ABY4X7P6_9SPHN|nr:relaxase/mobilization nuclease domain-containing protein [Sphingomonas morindae]USI72870.1 relaxase/mobilization nuclease domain-containing protein [Sphingomonas morindae]
MIGKSISRLNRRRVAANRRRHGIDARRAATPERIRHHATLLTNYLRDAHAKALKPLGLVGTPGHELLRYVADAQDQHKRSGIEVGEKVDLIGFRNIHGTDFEDAQRQILATMARSPGIDPLEHYVLSWRTGEQPTHAQVTDAVDTLVHVLGLEENQTIYAAHANTEHYHVHVAVNRVHPETFRRIAAGDDWEVDAIHQAVALIEHRQGWASEEKAQFVGGPDGVRERATGRRVRDAEGRALKRERRGRREDGSRERPLSPGAQMFERRTGQASFEREVREIVPGAVEEANGWDALHRRLAEHGLGIELHRSGAHITEGKRGIPASRAGRGASRQALEARFGPFEPRGREIVIRSRQPRVLPDGEKRAAYHDARSQHRAAIARHTNTLLAAKHDALTRITSWRQASLIRVDALDWRGNREGLNFARSLIAGETARQIAAVEASLGADVAALRLASSFPSFAAWNDGVQPPSIPTPSGGLLLATAPDAPRGQRVPGFSARPQGRSIAYLDGHGRTVFTDHGDLISVDRDERQVVRAAIVLGRERWGRVTLTGSDAFLAAAAAIIVDEGWTDIDGKALREAIAAERARREADAKRKLERQRPSGLTAAQKNSGGSGDETIPSKAAVRIEQRPITVSTLSDIEAPSPRAPVTSAERDMYADAYAENPLIDAWIDQRRRAPEALNEARTLALRVMQDRTARTYLSELEAEGYRWVIELRQQATARNQLLKRASASQSMLR